MKEETSSCQEVSYSIPGKVENYKCRTMMVPFGYPFNFDFAEKATEGDVVSLKNGTPVRIIRKTIVNTASPIADLISRIIYGRSMKETMACFEKYYGAPNIQNEEIIIMAYEIIG